MAWDYVTYYGNRKLRELIESDPEAKMKIKEAVYDAVEREVPDVTDDDDDFTKSSSVGMEAAMKEFERIQSRRMAAESFMDSLKSGWKKIKKAFADRPQVQLVGDNGQRQTGYLHDINKKKGTCTFILPREADESAAVAAAVAAGLAMRGGDKGGEMRKPKEFKPKFGKGEKATLVGAEEDLGSNKVPVEIEGFDDCGGTYMYFLKLLENANEGTETNPRFKCMESGQSDPLYICPYCGNDKVYDDSQSQSDSRIRLYSIFDGDTFRVERHCSNCDHYWDVVMKITVDHIDGDELPKDETNEMTNESAEPDYLDYDENTMYMLATEDENGDVKEFSVDLADESDWGNINTADGTCYYASGEFFDGIGWGNDEDGYQKITRVVDMRRGKDVRLEEFADIVDEFVSLYSDM